MRVEVTGRSAAEPDRVRVQAEGVRGWCTWPGAAVGTVDDVELDVADPVPWADLRVCDEDDEMAVPPGRDAVLVGTLREVDDLGVAAVLSLRGQAVQMVEVVGSARPDLMGRLVAVPVRGVTAHPTNL